MGFCIVPWLGSGVRCIVKAIISERISKFGMGRGAGLGVGILCRGRRVCRLGRVGMLQHHEDESLAWNAHDRLSI